jgi:hypothetical protein
MIAVDASTLSRKTTKSDFEVPNLDFVPHVLKLIIHINEKQRI